MQKDKILGHIFILFFTSIGICSSAQWNKTYLFVGTYTEAKPNKGIYIYQFNAQNGKLKKVSHGKNITNPSFLTLSPKGNFIYACTDTKLPVEGSISSFLFDSINGSFRLINKQKSGGVNPVYLTTSQNNEFVINGNYTDGTVSVYKTNRDGSLDTAIQLIHFQGNGPVAQRQDQSHIHAAVFSPDFKYIYFPDLGADKIRIFTFNKDQIPPLEALENDDYLAVPASGPRHFIFHPNNHFAYCIEELSGTVSSFKFNEGRLNHFQRIFSYSKIQDLYNSADIHISPDGLYLYATNRWDNENSISIFSIDTIKGDLTLIGHQSTYGDHPRNFTIDPSGNYLLVANQLTNNIIVFKRDIKTGLLYKTRFEIRVPRPSCLVMRKYGK